MDENNTEHQVEKLFHIFKSDNCYFVFDANLNKLTTISKSCYDFFGTHKILDRDRLFLTKLLTDARNVEFITNNDCAVISLNYSNKCNLNCKYCYQQKKPIYDMSIEDIYKVIDWSIDFFNPDAKKYIFSLNYNSEILLNFDKLKQIQIYLNDKSKSINKECELSFMSNGTLEFTDEIMQFIKESKMKSFGISIDGDKSYNDKTRKTKLGMSVFDKVENNIVKLQSNNIKVDACCVLSKYNINNIFENFEYFKSLNIYSIYFSLVKHTNINSKLTKNDINIALSEFDKVYNKLFYDIKNNDFNMFFMLINSPMIYPLIKIKDDIKQSKRCGWMENITVDEKKDIYPCNYFVGNEEFKLGNIENYNVIYNDLDKNELQVDNLEPCKHCWAKYLCGGTCYYSSYTNNGDIHKKDDIECMFKKGLIERALGFYGRLVEADLWDKVLEHLK